MLRYAIVNKDGAYLTQMGWLASRDYALKFARHDEAVIHIANNRLQDAGAVIKQIDDPDAAPVRTGFAETEYDPWGLGNER